MTKIKPAVIVGVALAGAAGLWFLSANKRGFLGLPGYAQNPAPADLYPQTLSNASLPFGVEFPPLPNMITNIDAGGCCAACDPSRRITSLASGELPILQEAALAPALPNIPNSLTPAAFQQSSSPQAIMGPGLYGYSKPNPAYATKQSAPYLTEIMIAPNGTTAPGFAGGDTRERAYA